MFKRKNLWIAMGSALAVASFGSMATTAYAQDDQDFEEEEVLEQVLVTGSRIMRLNMTSPTAVATIDAQEILASGYTNVADVLRSVPSFGVSAITSANSNFSTSGGGINTLQLRNLGEDRTLVLVNGRRYVSGLAGSAAVDFNTVPVELIERVEVITGGASAVYGSDALAGVINVILKDDFQGIETGYQYGAANDGGDVRHRSYLLAGGEYADGGNAVFSISYSRDDGLLARERSNTEVDDIALCRLTGQISDCQTPRENFFSSFAEGGRFFVPSTGSSFGIVSGTGAEAEVAPWNTARFGFNRQEFRRYTVPTERYLVSGLMDYELDNGVEIFMETTYAQTRTQTELEPFPHSNSDANIAGVPVDNPFVPQAIRDAVLAAGDTHVEYWRRTTELGQRGSSAVRNTFRWVTGLRGDIDDKYNWETYFAYGRMDDAQQGTGQINVFALREALDVIDGPGGPICASDAARAEGCVPVNLFGLGGISPAAADWLRAPSARQQTTQQKVAGATISGPAWDLWAGSLDFAAGIETRDEYATDVPDVLTQRGLNAGNAEAPTEGGYDVTELFLELELPLLRDAPLVHDLSIGGAYRYSDYSSIGSTDAYTGRLQWAPIESLRFRTQYARAVRAPNIGELFAPGGENFAPVSDPCNNVTATTPGDVAANCRTNPGIAARIADQGIFLLTQPEIQGTGGFTGKGNENLRFETSDSYTFGFVYDESFGGFGEVTLSADWFDIEIEDLIDTVGRQTSVDFCYNVPQGQFPNDFCAFVVRDGRGAAFQQGEITEVNSGFLNEGKLETEGIDFAVAWGWTFSDWVGVIPGQGSLRLAYTYLIDYTLTKFGAPDELVGEVGVNEDKMQLGFTYLLGDWNFNWEWNHLSNAVPDKSNALFDFNVGSYNVHDFRVSYSLGFDETIRNANLYAGINNAFDEDAPIILSGIPGNTTGTDTNASVYNPIGPTYYLGFQLFF